MSGFAFWNVDTQHDFMDSDGALYVPDAESIRPGLRALTAYARECQIRVMGSVDAHAPSDSEMQGNGGPFPLHCLAGERGQRMIPETAPLRPLFVPTRPCGEDQMARILRHPGEIYFEKQHYDVFTNPNTEPVLEALGIRKVALYGVATDYCDLAAALGLRRSGIEVFLVEDAVRPVTERGGRAAMTQMLRAGVRTVTLSQVMEGYFAEEFQQQGKAGTKMTLEEKSKVRTYSATDRDHEMLEVVARYHGISKSAMITGLVRKEFWRIFPSGTESIRPEEGARITS